MLGRLGLAGLLFLAVVAPALSQTPPEANVVPCSIEGYTLCADVGAYTALFKPDPTSPEPVRFQNSVNLTLQPLRLVYRFEDHEDLLSPVRPTSATSSGNEVTYPGAFDNDSLSFAVLGRVLEQRLVLHSPPRAPDPGLFASVTNATHLFPEMHKQ
ncbi:MAG: hypothetical protein QXO51_03930 [Halobacteria archaeon]